MAPTRTRPGAARLATLALATALVVFGGATAASGRSATLLGKPASAPKPNCPRACSAIGSVTGFQTRAQGVKNPFQVRKRGHIVAWRVSLGRPDRESRDFFGDLFGRPALGEVPTARLAILKKQQGRKFKLVRQSPIVDLSPFYGERPVITLENPLRVRKGHIVAITTQTWLPSLAAANRVRRSKWRASRRRGKCGARGARNARPHKKVGSTRGYGCQFADRLLYWAYFTPRG